MQNKIKTTTTITASLIIGLIMLSPITALPNVIASTNSQTQTLSSIDLAKQNMPKELSSSDLAKAVQIATSDGKVQSMIGGKSVKVLAQGFFGNIKENPVVWYPTLNIGIDDKQQIMVVVDLVNGKVTQADQGPDLDKRISNTQRSWASDYYSGSSTIQGHEMTPTNPTFTPNSSYNFTAFLVNAVMSGSTDSQLCNSGSTSSYWMQTGFFFDPSSSAKTVWTDTKQSCSALSTPITYNTSHSYQFYIFGDSVASKWTVEVFDNTLGTSYIHSVSGQSSFTLKVNDFNSGVFFENANTVHGTSSWNTQFSGTALSATALMEQSGSWVNWNADTKQDDQGCKPPITDTVITGNLQSGHSATWNLTTMANNYPAC
ncbi:MAG TPA: hypothetical protein VGR54_02905 [Nitrosopumilaceae archaeon]|nr:hypothetical protein [Nitrosopumilaceae archaeon]